MATYLESGVERLEVPTKARISQDDCEHVLRCRAFSSPGLGEDASSFMDHVPDPNIERYLVLFAASAKRCELLEPARIVYCDTFNLL